MSPELELIRALAEDLSLEILASYTPDDFSEADFTNLGKAAVYLAEHAPLPALRSNSSSGKSSRQRRPTRPSDRSGPSTPKRSALLPFVLDTDADRRGAVRPDLALHLHLVCHANVDADSRLGG